MGLQALDAATWKEGRVHIIVTGHGASTVSARRTNSTLANHLNYGTWHLEILFHPTYRYDTCTRHLSLSVTVGVLKLRESIQYDQMNLLIYLTCGCTTFSSRYLGLDSQGGAAFSTTLRHAKR